MYSQDTNIDKKILNSLSDKEREIVFTVLGDKPQINGTWLAHLDELSTDERNAYFEQLAHQPQLIKAAEERKKTDLLNLKV